ncbi:phosphotransferase [Alkalimonas amylolytica]|uniref:Phosphotransferase enzyme family protein n=1 Tax=Alkalimonas amylolytica TaxID=152573 RepID=A0A1H4CC76_ALKAM|nr:phosphotransferase [Alkalimonas amylolytica]SEA57966.1 Phosphotransferase enzyme family protein [Alkalimonas amylolytica]
MSNSAKAQDVLQQVCQDQDLIRLYGEGFRIDSHQIIETPFSTVFRLHSSSKGTPFRLYLKTLCESSDQAKAKAGIQNEYDIMVRLSQQFDRVKMLDVPHPVKLYADSASLLTEEVAGTELEDLLTGAARLFGQSSVKAAVQMTELAGVWLREFQQMTADKAVSVSFEPLALYCQERIDYLLQQQAPGVSASLNKAFMQLAKAAQAEGMPHGVFVAGCHGDFAPHNMITNKERLAVIDFTDYRMDCSLFDPINFLEKVGRMHNHFFYRSSFVEQLQSAFLKGYSLLGPEVTQSACYRLIRARCVLLRLFHYFMCRTRSWHMRIGHDAAYRESLAELHALLGSHQPSVLKQSLQ